MCYLLAQCTTLHTKTRKSTTQVFARAKKRREGRVSISKKTMSPAVCLSDMHRGRRLDAEAAVAVAG